MAGRMDPLLATRKLWEHSEALGFPDNEDAVTILGVESEVEPLVFLDGKLSDQKDFTEAELKMYRDLAKKACHNLLKERTIS